MLKTQVYVRWHCIICLSKNPAYRAGNLADTLLEDGEVLEREWRDNVVTDSFYPFQIPRSGHNPSIASKTVRDNFKNYFMNEGVVYWQWKCCQKLYQ